MGFRYRRALSGAGLLLATALAGCGADDRGHAEPVTMVYVSNADSAEITVLRLDNTTGSLTPSESIRRQAH